MNVSGFMELYDDSIIGVENPNEFIVDGHYYFTVNNIDYYFKVKNTNINNNPILLELYNPYFEDINGNILPENNDVVKNIPYSGIKKVTTKLRDINESYFDNENNVIYFAGNYNVFIADSDSYVGKIENPYIDGNILVTPSVTIVPRLELVGAHGFTFNNNTIYSHNQWNYLDPQYTLAPFKLHRINSDLTYKDSLTIPNTSYVLDMIHIGNYGYILDCGTPNTLNRQPAKLFRINLVAPTMTYELLYQTSYNCTQGSLSYYDGKLYATLNGVETDLTKKLVEFELTNHTILRELSLPENTLYDINHARILAGNKLALAYHRNDNVPNNRLFIVNLDTFTILSTTNGLTDTTDDGAYDSITNIGILGVDHAPERIIKIDFNNNTAIQEPLPVNVTENKAIWNVANYNLNIQS
jgi:hypothetical protein